MHAVAYQTTYKMLLQQIGVLRETASLAVRANVPKEIYPREMEPRVHLCAPTWAANCDLGILSN